MVKMNWYVFAIISSLFSTGFLLFRKKGLTHVHSTEFATTRTITAAVCGLILLPFIAQNYTLLELGMIYVVALFASIAILFTTKALKHMEISVVVPLQNLVPAFLVLWSYIFLSESLDRLNLLGIALLIVGTYVLEMDNKFHYLWKPIRTFIKSKYSHYVILSVLFFSFSAMFDRIVLLKYSTPLKFLAVVWIFIAINFFIFHSIKYGGYKEIIYTIKKTKHQVILAGAFAFLATYFYYMAASLTYIALVVPIKRLSSLSTTIVGGEIFHEKHLLHKAAACIIMIIGATIIIIH